MFICYCFQWILGDIRNKRKRKHLEREIELGALENQAEDGLPPTNFDIGKHFKKKPIINLIIQIWSYFEILLLIIVLCSRREILDGNNHLYNGECQKKSIIINAALWRILTTIFLLIGSNKVI